MSEEVHFNEQKSGYQSQSNSSYLRGSSEDAGLRTTSSYDETLRVQLVQLNERSRWYSTQIWQIPFSYLGIVALSIGFASSKNNTLMTGLIFLALGAFGTAVFHHNERIQNGVKRAVINIQKVEEQLHLEQTAIYNPNYWAGFRITIIIITLACFLLGIYFLLPVI